MVDGVNSLFDEMTDLAPVGCIGDRHEWIGEFSLHSPGVPTLALISGGGNAFALDVNFNHIPAPAPMTVTLGTGTAS